MKSLFHTDKNIWSLLKRNVSKGQLIGYVLSNALGLTVVLTGIMFYLDSSHSSGKNDSFFSRDYIVVSKKVEGVGFSPVSFGKEDMERLEQQPWVKRIGRFTSSRFAVNGAVDIGGRGLSTYLFFESVPDDFFDIKPRDWKFDPAERFVPIILCKDYMALYNFGFAAPQGLPQISEELACAIPIRLRVSGNNMMSETFDAAIVGFSSRLNTIAVPQDFMDWANERYAPGAETNPSRLIVEIDRLAAADMDKYLDKEDMEIGGDMSGDGNISKFLGTASAVVTANGIVICALAIFILVLSIFLLLQKSRQKLHHLMLLGYAPAEVGAYYEFLVVTANIIVTLAATTATLLLRQTWEAPLKEIGLGEASIVPMLASSMLYLLAVTAINIRIIRRHMTLIWNNG